ncbi:hypothetical protein [Streptomyces odonnellii]|uniref:hypothetical protein n=1 Tax=Streptomyces odonnellii TaxID=1417980 RepID=UPI0012FF1298|nr:hypothetical protein [Streptomyces odonnellii]
MRRGEEQLGQAVAEQLGLAPRQHERRNRQETVNAEKAQWHAYLTGRQIGGR